ncbi:glutamine-dependent NAD(+) synthetase-like [Schistocerca gregaria]|uniref:glutamine-dependent NAD(+) synthetase-like n=1 Tax=Schistocerca gregaria TaxID=7010 RepID=UPI00211EADF4|nr:glutamine-dependent NAD(+) synthetase-like [Schistocerca gregaria]
MSIVTLATCSLAQWSLDFYGNLNRIVKSIVAAKNLGARYRLGPELELCGYGCEDHFLEPDTVDHCWETLEMILRTPNLTKDILVDVGMPVLYQGVLYNCRVFICDSKVLLIRPKLYLADSGNYRESRYFASWKTTRRIESIILPKCIQDATGQAQALFGWAYLRLNDTLLASEMCEELFVPDSPHLSLGLHGVEIFANGSGSHHQLGKLKQRVDLIRSATVKGGGIYLYANQQCCDGGRLYYDGCAMIVCNGEVLAQGRQFSLDSCEVISATVELQVVRSARASIHSRCEQATSHRPYIPEVRVDFSLTHPPKRGTFYTRRLSQPVEVELCELEQEMAFGPACWLWSYLRRSGASGFFLPLSGGSDSACVATIVAIMCKLVMQWLDRADPRVVRDVKRIGRYSETEDLPRSSEELCKRILYTCYMQSQNSSPESRDLADRVASTLNTSHSTLEIDAITSEIEKATTHALGSRRPRFRLHGGTAAENLALQNMQARSRMVLSYAMAQLAVWARDSPSQEKSENADRSYPSLLVLGSGNLDETLQGYFTKYDCSSADLNPIGSISKVNIRGFLVWASDRYEWLVLREVAESEPTAELEPYDEKTGRQRDEVDMGISYEELAVMGRLRKQHLCGPVSMFRRLLGIWGDKTAREVAEKVKRFFYRYATNRHKSTVLTPSYHAESHSSDDSRYDPRPFLYNVKWKWQFSEIDSLVAETEEEMNA